MPREQILVRFSPLAVLYCFPCSSHLSLPSSINIQDPLPLACLRQKTALPNNLPLDDFLAGKTIDNTMDPECHEVYGISGSQKETSPSYDCDHINNRYVPLHDKPSKKRRCVNTAATMTNKTKV
jgi:hypothetical protein